MHRMSQRIGLSFLLMGGLFLNVWPVALAPQVARAEEFANPAFKNLWFRSDGLVAASNAARPYVWGREPFATRTERYENSPNRQRLVQYFPKGRMEITRPDGDATNQWYVSSGLLVRDMVAGVVQIGDNLVQLYRPVNTPVVGDENQPLASTPRYGDVASVAFNSSAARSLTGQPITRTLRAGDPPNTGGRVVPRASNAQPKINYGYFEPTSRHNIAAPFWDFMNATGQVYAPNGEIATAPIFDWQYILGYPLTEAYWVNAKIEGKTQEVLVQFFQRRVLYFNPAAPASQQVDFTNVGSHWYNWQYGPVVAYTGDTTVPDSVNATISPKLGEPDTIFQVQAPGFKAAEPVNVSVTRPDGSILSEKILGSVRARPDGTLRLSFYGDTFQNNFKSGLSEAADAASPYGIYRMDFKGQQSLQTGTVFWRLIPAQPVTPATPYNQDNSPAPPGLNTVTDPNVGPQGSLFPTFVSGFQVKDIFAGKVATWITTPGGDAYPTSIFGLAEDLEEALDGSLFVLSSPPYPGIWSITLADKANPSKLAIIYLKVTEAPPELTVGAALGIFSRGTTSAKPGQWAAEMQWQNLRPQPKVELEEGE